MKKLAGVVVLYNPDINVVDNIKSYIQKLDVLYVVDNSNNKNFEKKIFDQKIIYIPNFSNLGVAKALNIGAEMAIEDGYKWLLTMDQDSHFSPDSISKMMLYLEENSKIKKIGLISPWHNIKTGIKKPEKEIEEMIEVMTSGNIINLEAYKNIGGFKDWLFIDGIDFEFCMNLNKNGYKVLRLNYVELEHELGDIVVKKALNRNFVCSNHNYIRRYYMVRNINYIFDMYNDTFPEYCQFIKNGLNGAMRNILIFEKDKYRKLRNMLRGYLDYKRNIKGPYNYKN